MKDPIKVMGYLKVMRKHSKKCIKKLISIWIIFKGQNMKMNLKK